MSSEVHRELVAYGLTDREAAVYAALLPHRNIGSSKLIRATGLHGQFVYDALSSLEEKGLALHVIQNGRKKFSPGNPQRLVALIEEKRIAAKAVARELEKRYGGAGEQSFEVFQGEHAFAAHQLDMLSELPHGSEILVIASETERYMATFDALGLSDEYEHVRKDHALSIRYLGGESQRDRLSRMAKERHLWRYRILPGQSTGITSTEIHPEMVSFVAYGQQLLDFTLRNREVAAGYRAFFETLWSLSKE